MLGKIFKMQSKLTSEKLIKMFHKKGEKRWLHTRDTAHCKYVPKSYDYNSSSKSSHFLCNSYKRL